jgi:galacturan 1,4-alpha-galacturonidase
MINVNNITGLKIRSLTGKGVIDGNGQNAYVATTPDVSYVGLLHDIDANNLDRWDLFATDSSYARPTLLYVRQALHLTKLPHVQSYKLTSLHRSPAAPT